MTPARLLERLHGAALRIQLPLVLAAVPVIIALYALAVVPIAVAVTVPDASPAMLEAATRAARAAVVMLVLSVAVATGAAGMLLRGSLRATVDRLKQATDAIARGDFRHRVASGRTDELGQLAASIDVMAGRLQRLEHSRRRMLACVSHELRTPLTIIQGYAFTLARHEQDAIRRDQLDLIQGEAARLAGLIEDLVEAASLHAGGVRLRVAPMDLAMLVRLEAERFHEEAGMRDVTIDVRLPDAPVAAEIDPSRMGQVMANLIANAVRHAERASSVQVTLEATRGEPIRVAVENQCEPMPDHVVDHAFEPFVQGEARSGSVGLGLAIVHAIVVAHGGSVQLDRPAALQGRARFEVELPASCAPHTKLRRGLRVPRPVVAARLAVER